MGSCTFFPIFGHQYHGSGSESALTKNAGSGSYLPVPSSTYLPTYPPEPTYLPSVPTYLPRYLHTYRYLSVPTYLLVPTYLPIPIGSVSPRADLFSSTLSCNKKEEKNHQTSQHGRAPCQSSKQHGRAPCQSRKQQERALPKGARPLAIK